jgi:hypothetical protein
MSTNSANVVFTNGTSITIDTTTIYTGSSTITTGGTITIGGGTFGTGGTTWPNTGGVTYYPQPHPTYLDDYGFGDLFAPPKKETEVLVDELKSSIFAELDKYIEAVEGNKEPDQNYDELMAKAEIMHEMLALASDMIKDRVDKLKKAKDRLLLDGLESAA